MMNNDNSNIFGLLRKIFSKLNSRRKFQVSIFFIVIFFSALAETTSVSAAIPFLKIVTNPSQLIENNLLTKFLSFFINESSELTILSICIFLAISASIAALLKVFSLWYGSRLSALIGVDLSSECYEKNLYKPYHQHLKDNSSQLLSNNTLFINRTVDLLQSTSRFFIAFISAVFLSIFLFIYNTYFSIFALITFLLIYVFLAKFLNRKLSNNSKIISSKGELQIQLMQESIGGIRDIILANNYQKYISYYKTLDRKIRLGLGNNDFINLFPRYAIEGLFLSFIALMTYFLSSNNLSKNELLPVIGIFVIGAQKLLPCIQQCYSCWSYIRGNISSIITVIKNLNEPLEKIDINNLLGRLDFKKELKIKNLSFKYSSVSPTILKNVNFSISKGERIAILGQTGSGKSTLMDILMGLLRPSFGSVEVDNVDIFNKFNPQRIIHWQSQIAHVPQNIFLSNASIAQNIAFGSMKKELNFLNVKKAARDAMIEDFILKQPLKYESIIGENGINLSGGQKQRIAIARALYKNCKVIIFDEATSSLDKKTEKKILDTIYNLNKDITIIMITHRESTIYGCDKILEVNHGLVNLRPIKPL